MKKILILIFLTFTSFVFSIKDAFEPIEYKWETDLQGNEELNFYNIDYCDYFLKFSNGNTLDLRPGKNTAIRITPANIDYYNIAFPNTFQFFKGRIVNKFNSRYLYALPIKSGDSTQYKTNTKNRDLTFVFKYREIDTVYAVRGGVVCLFDATDLSAKFVDLKKENILLIYHNDNTFAQYSGFLNTFVVPGEIVNVGQPIGLVKAVNNKEDLFLLSIEFFFLDRNKVDNDETANKHSHFSPVFYTRNYGSVKLEEGITYISELNDSIIIQDMSKMEKKRYMKKINK